MLKNFYLWTYSWVRVYIHINILCLFKCIKVKIVIYSLCNLNKSYLHFMWQASEISRPVGELHFCLLCPPCTALDHASNIIRKLAYVPGPTFGFVKLLASSGSHCTKWADEQHRQAGFESRLLPDLPLPFIPTLIGLRAFDLVSSRVWWQILASLWN